MSDIEELRTKVMMFNPLLEVMKIENHIRLKLLKEKYNMNNPQPNTKVQFKVRQSFPANNRRQVINPKFGVFIEYQEMEVFYVSDSEYYMPEQIETWREC